MVRWVAGMEETEGLGKDRPSSVSALLFLQVEGLGWDGVGEEEEDWEG